MALQIGRQGKIFAKLEAVLVNFSLESLLRLSKI